MKAFEDLKESTKKDIIIDGLMRSKGVYLLVSKPKVGKSLFTLQLANSIANGKPFLGHEILKPPPVLYITTELSDNQLKDRCNLLGISFKKNTFFAIDRSDKQSINFRDIEYEVKEFAEEYNGKILILDMLKDISFDISYDINSYQDIAQKLMPQIRSYADKYNLTILFVHHLNKLGKTLGSTGFDAVVDGIIRLSKNCYDDSTIKMEIINKDFPDDEEYLHKDKNQVFSIAKDNALETQNPIVIGFVKYAIRENNFDFTISEIINKNQYLSVNKNIVATQGDEKKSYMVTTPKTKSSIRNIPIPKVLMEDMKVLYEVSKRHYGFNDDWYLFGDTDPITNGKLRHRKNKDCKLADVKQIRIHDFRHSCASLLINSGATINVVAKYLGHTKIDETLNTYSHLFKNQLNEIINIIDKLN